MTEPTTPAIDRELMEGDLDTLARVLAPRVERALPLPVRMALTASGSSVARLISDALRPALGLADDDLAELIDAAGTELGAWRVRRWPFDRTAHPAAVAAFERLREAVL